MDQKVVSNGGKVVRLESIDQFTKVVVAVSRDDDYEWGIIHNGRVQAESYMGYGDPATALRDALIYEACGKVLTRRDDAGFALGKPTAFVYPALSQPLVEVHG